MTKRKRTKEQTTIYKTKHRKQKILTKTEVNSDASEGSTDPAPYVTSVAFLLSDTRGVTCQSFSWHRFDPHIPVHQGRWLREYDTVGIAKWFFHENSWFGQFRHALSKYAKKNTPSWLIFRDIYDRISTIFRQIFKIRIFIAVKKISQFQNGKR